MKLLEKLASRFGQSAAVGATDSVKVEAKKAAVSLGPVLLGVGTVLIGIAAFRSSSHAMVSPRLTQTRIVTNNWFLTDAQNDILKQIAKEAMQ